MIKQISKLDETSMASLAKMSIASAVGFDFDDGGESSNDSYETLANLSYRRSPVCDACFCGAACPDHPLLHTLARWTKIIVRSKHGMTVLFGVFPLAIGLLLGIYIGRKWEQRGQAQKQQIKTRPKSSRSQNPLIYILHQSTIRALNLFYCAKHFLISLTLTANNPQIMSPETQTGQSSDELQIIKNEQEYKETRLTVLKDSKKFRESGVDLDSIPKHIAFIMDGNRRYGKAKYGSAARGHVDGGYKLRDMVSWCIEECIEEMTVYAFSTENWNRSKAEVDALMSIFCQQVDELRKESVKLQIIVKVLSTETAPIPNHVKEKLRQLEVDTKHSKGVLVLNVCLSYGSRGEIVLACRNLAKDCCEGNLSVSDIDEPRLESRLLTNTSRPLDLLLRTSGEIRISNFLLWQAAYTEFFFVSKHWPELEKEDLLQVIRDYAHGRKRRYGT